MTIIECHITQAPYRPVSGEAIEDKHFLATGATYGRVLFTDRPPLIEVDTDDVTITDCMLQCLGDGVAIEVKECTLNAKHLYLCSGG